MPIWETFLREARRSEEPRFVPTASIGWPPQIAVAPSGGITFGTISVCSNRRMLPGPAGKMLAVRDNHAREPRHTDVTPMNSGFDDVRPYFTLQTTTTRFVAPPLTVTALVMVQLAFPAL